MKTRKQITSTNKEIFEDFIKHASQPLFEQTKSRDSSTYRSDKKTRSHNFF